METWTLLVRGSTVEHFLHVVGTWFVRLYRGDGHGHFQDVTAAAGITARGWGMGVAVGDIDNDGREDIYITCYGPNKLFHNLGDGKFEEIASKAGLDDPRWSVGASFADLDHDGDLDLYVANYLVYDLGNLPQRQHPVPIADSTSFAALGDCPALGMPCSSMTGKGISRMSRSNETSIRNRYTEWEPPSLITTMTAGRIFSLPMTSRQIFFITTWGRASLKRWGSLAGAAFDENGVEEGTMGGSFGDFNNDGWPDLYYTNSSYETNQLCVNNQKRNFFS